jgi:hypothetical protein
VGKIIPSGGGGRGETKCERETAGRSHLSVSLKA